MIPERLTPWLIGGILLALIAAAAGWALGDGIATEAHDADAARAEGYEQGFSLVSKEAARATARRGFSAGIKAGRRIGAKNGASEGSGIGAGNAKIEAAVEAEKAAEAASASAQTELADRQSNCGSVRAAPSWCPTSEEISGYRAAIRAAKKAAKKKEAARGTR